MKRLDRELRSVSRELLDTKDDLDATNEELRATNAKVLALKSREEVGRRAIVSLSPLRSAVSTPANPEVEYEAAVDRPDSVLLGIRRVYTEEGSATTKYMSRLMYNGIAYVLGEFKSKEDAALAHDTAQRELHGERAIINYVTKAKSDR
ncbi:hypothetical protein TrLO_g432 [Triparma laevis f. longispina]|uniref:AP2/ERF domain-containing protein n=1 Tax=Triparma laevis f. longispina TaxID=1714387 RepID=A0A9W7E8S4_9STRA|nr:hypothetical protein TrLO_g432 [Triparma laevis f. longispina]